ncbi:retrovirus-related pol polyprotein from transposon TNT 1-94 [Tanacetum coccineum]
MDPMISLGQKNTLVEYMIPSGADNRPPMLDKDLYDSWKTSQGFFYQYISSKLPQSKKPSHIKSMLVLLIAQTAKVKDIWLGNALRQSEPRSGISADQDSDKSSPTMLLARTEDQFDSIKQTRVRHKEQSDSLINKLNLKSVENEDLKAQIQEHSAKKVTVKPMNNVKKVRFAKPLTSSSNIKQVESSNTSDSNTPVLSSTGVKCSTSNCGSKPPGNKKNDRISQTPSRNKKNKVEAQPRKVNKVNCVFNPVCDVDVMHSLCLDGTLVSGLRMLKTHDNGISLSSHETLQVNFWHQTSVARTSQQNGVVERQNRTLVEAARTMLIFSKAPLFLWAEAINTALDTPEVTSKQAMIELSWIDAMQEEIHEFKRLGVWELVSCPDNVFLIKLKWIYKVNTDELVGLMQLRSRGVSGPLAVCTSGKRTQFLGDKLVSGRKEQKEHWHIEYRGDLTFLIDSLAEKALSRETLKRLAEETDE